MIDYLLVLVCGWTGGVITTVVARYVLDGQKPLDAALLPVSIATPPPTLAEKLKIIESPYAPRETKPERNSPYTDALKLVWRAAKKERATHWNAAKPPEPRPPKPPPPQPPEPIRPAASTSLLPHVPWGG